MPKEKISARQLQPGLYIELPLKWNEHPFLFGRFKLKDVAEIKLIQQLGVEQLWYYPEKSQVAPLQETVAPPAAPADETAMQAQWDEKKEHAESLRKRRLEIQRVEKQYNEVVGNVKELMSMMANAPVQAMEQATKMVGSIVATLQADKETLVHLMNANNLDDSLYYHVLNVSVLSLLLAREMGVQDKEKMMTLGLAALMHDIGQVKLPPQILRKTSPLSKPESDLYERHVRYALEMVGLHAKLKLTVKPLLLTIIEQHHVMLDGSGYPSEVSPAKMHPLSKILATVNYYDKLCNHVDPKQSMTPHEALSLMFSKQVGKFDKQTLQTLVKLLGIYPPGTVVQLSDESTGIVISLNRSELLKPGVLIYSADIPKEEAVIIDLTKHTDLTIRKSLRPAQLSKEMFEYLNPRERVSYFFALNKPQEN